MESTQEHTVPKPKQGHQKPIFLPSQLHNANVLSYYKDISCLVLGSACGILQLHALQGLLFFMITSLLSSAFFQVSMTRFGSSDGRGHQITEFYASPVKDIYFGDIGRNAATFTMMWCLLNALVSY